MTPQSRLRLDELRRLRIVRELTAAERQELAELARAAVLASRPLPQVTRCRPG